MKPYNENIELKEFLVKYKENWNEFFKKWEKDPKATFEEDVIWSKRPGKVWKTKEGKEKSTELEYDVFPQPYLGNYQNHSVITLNLNPSRSKKGVKKFNLKNGEKGNENDVFEEKHLQEFLKKPKKDYYEYAKGFPTYDIDFWQNQKNWIDRIFKKLGKDAPSENKIKPFAIEICPWGSKKFQNLKIKKDDPLIEYMDQHVFDVIEKVIEYSKLKIVLSVGKAYYNIFDNKKTDFERLDEISYQENKPEGIDWPQTIDEDSGKDRDVKRTFSIWKKGKILYINTYASGSNTPPAKHFNEIQNKLIEKHLNKL